MCNDSISTSRRFCRGGLLLAALLLTAITPAVSAADMKPATIDATAMGTSTRLGANVDVKVIINRFSTEEDRTVLVAAFKKSQVKGLVDTLSKINPWAVSPSRHTGIRPGLHSPVSYSHWPQDPVATNRLIRFGEAYHNTQSTAFDLTAGEFDLNDADKDKSSGVLFPACS